MRHDVIIAPGSDNLTLRYELSAAARICRIWQNRPMRFVTYNIQYSKGKDGVHDLERVAAEVAGADIIALQEVVRNIPGVPDGDQPGRLAELLDGYHWVYGPALDMDAGQGPGVRLQFGNMLLSRHPVLSSRLLLLPRVRTIEDLGLERGALEGVIDAPSGPLRVYSVHLDHLNPRHRRGEISRLRDAVLAAPLTGTTLTGGPWEMFETPIQSLPVTTECVVMGDFNMSPESGEYDEMVGEVGYEARRTVTTDRFADTWSLCGRPLDQGATWSEGEAAIKLDYVFVTAGLAGRVKRTWIDTDAQGSDHDPLWMELDV